MEGAVATAGTMPDRTVPATMAKHHRMAFAATPERTLWLSGNTGRDSALSA